MKTKFLAQETLRGVKKNATITSALVIAVAISLTLLATAILVQRQTTTMKDYWYDKVELSVFLCGSTSSQEVCERAISQKERDDVREVLENHPLVSEIYYESSEEAYGRFKEQFAESPILTSVKPEDLPESFRVKLVTPDAYDEVATVVQELPGVEQVKDQKELLERFFSLLTVAQNVTLFLSFAMLAVTCLLIVNTVRLSAYTRKKETSVMKLVGATNLSISLPFIAEAVITTLAGSFIAIFTLFSFQYFVVDKILAETYTNTSFITWTDIFSTSLLVILIGVTIATLSAAFSVKKYLKT